MFSCSVLDISQVISGYREAEKSSWHSEVSLSVVHRIREVTFCCCVTTINITTASTTCVHVLHLEKNGLVFKCQSYLVF